MNFAAQQQEDFHSAYHTQGMRDLLCVFCVHRCIICDGTGSLRLNWGVIYFMGAYMYIECPNCDGSGLMPDV